MFAIYTEDGRYFRSTLEDLYRVAEINRVKDIKAVQSDEPEEKEQEKLTQPNATAIEAYKKVINARREEAIYHASQIMKRPVVTVFEDSSIQDCYDLIENRSIKQLPVLNNEGKPVGLLTKENLLKIIIVENDAISYSEGDSIRSVISQPMIAADPVADIRRVAKVMYDHSLNCIPITNDTDQIVGIITRTDIIYAVSMYPAITLWA